MTCPKCKTEVPEMAVFCSQCGFQLKATPTVPLPAEAPPAETPSASPAQPLAGEELIPLSTASQETTLTATSIPLAEENISSPYADLPIFEQQTLVGAVPTTKSTADPAWESFGPYAIVTEPTIPNLAGQTPYPRIGGQSRDQEPKMPDAIFPPHLQPITPLPPSAALVKITRPLPEFHPQMLISPSTPPPAPPAGPPWTRILAPRFGKISTLLPLWISLPLIVLVLIILVSLYLTGSDWADGAMRASIAGIVIASLIALATGIRALAGMRKLKQFIYAGLSVLVLVVFSIAGLTQQSGIHRFQAHYLEDRQQWTQAIFEYDLAGEKAPTSLDIARVYVDWGKQLSSKTQYSAAIEKFDIVLNKFASATSEVKRAQAGKVATYLAWSKKNFDTNDFSTAVQLYDTLLALDYCDTTCQDEAKPLDAKSYYELGELKLSQQLYDDAITYFTTIQSRFSATPSATGAHTELAAAYLGKGKKTLESDCPAALPLYQKVVDEFADTPSAILAKTDLEAPQKVTGHFTKPVPGGALRAVVFLAKNLRGDISQDQYRQEVARAIVTNINSDGTFQFTNIKLDTYDLVWGTVRNDGAYSYVFFSDRVTNEPTYVATVGPLCGFSFGDIKEDIPTPA